MKSLFSILGLSFLSLTLTNCSLSPEQIASRLKPSNEVSLVSAKGVDYRKLRDLLKAKKWKEADQETTVKILEVANRESEGWLHREDAKIFPCQDLGTIDKLWVKYSNGKFGFSVQKQIYQGIGGSKDFNWPDYEKLGDKVRWRQGGRWLLYNKLTFSIEAEQHYTGYLPWGVSTTNPNERPIFLSCGDL